MMMISEKIVDRCGLRHPRTQDAVPAVFTLTLTTAAAAVLHLSWARSCIASGAKAYLYDTRTIYPVRTP